MIHHYSIPRQSNSDIVCYRLIIESARLEQRISHCQLYFFGIFLRTKHTSNSYEDIPGKCRVHCMPYIYLVMAVNRVSPRFRATKNFYSLFLSFHNPVCTHSSIFLPSSVFRLFRLNVDILLLLIVFYTKTDNDLPR